MALGRKISSRTGLGFLLGGFFFFLLALGYFQLHSKLEQLRISCVLLSDSPAEVSSSRRSLQTDVSASDDTIVIYNRVPKTGSTSFVGVAYDLCERNKFHVIHLNVSRNNHVLSLSDQVMFVNNVSNWNEKKPGLYHGHIAYLHFPRFGVGRSPIYINVVREPLDRLVSYYYFLRHGDDFRPHVKRRKAGDQETFDECVARDGSDCSTDHLWMQIPFFCGHSAECWTVGSEWALEVAKHNLVNNFLVVGTTEDLREFVAVLEAALPRYFTGALQHFTSGNRSHLRKTYNRLEPSVETVQKIQKSTVWKMENEFYLFAKEQFQHVKEMILDAKFGLDSILHQKANFFFEKIKPQ